MKNRGPILIVFGASLIMSPLAISIVTAAKARQADPARIELTVKETAACTALALREPTAQSSCGTPQRDGAARRMAAGGALFVASR